MGDDVVVEIGGDSYQWIEVAGRFTSPFNLTGMPAVVVPCGLSSEGLPVGIQFATLPHRDDLALRAARAYEPEAGLSTTFPTGVSEILTSQEKSE